VGVDGTVLRWCQREERPEVVAAVSGAGLVVGGDRSVLALVVPEGRG